MAPRAVQAVLLGARVAGTSALSLAFQPHGHTAIPADGCCCGAARGTGCAPIVSMLDGGFMLGNVKSAAHAVTQPLW